MTVDSNSPKGPYPPDEPGKPPPGNPPSDGGKPPDHSGSSHQLRMRRAALAGCYRYAYWKHPRYKLQPEHKKGPFQLAPMSLGDAVDFLKSDSDVSVKNHSIAWLMETVEGDANDHLARLMGRDELQRMRASLSARTVPLRRSHDLPAQSLGAAAPDDDSIFTIVLGLLGGGCLRKGIVVTPGQRADLVSTVKVRVDVNRDASEPGYAVLADPQSWKRNAPLYFLSSDKCFVTSSGVSMDPAPPPVGQPWSGQLFERVSMSWSPFFPIDGQNVLNVSLVKGIATDPFKYKMDCNLYQALSQTLGYSQKSGGIDVDTGGMTISRIEDGWTRVEAIKEARFTRRDICGWEFGFWLNVFAPFWMVPWMTLLTYEGACV